MNQYVYYALCAVLTGGVMLGIYLMSKVQKSVIGNRLSAVCMLLAIILTLVYNNILSVWVLYIALAVGTIIGIYMSVKIKMIQMPQMVALLNGLGGAASAIVGGFAMFAIGTGMDPFSKVTSAVALAVGLLTLVGSLVAAGKLHKILPQKPVVYKGHQLMTTLSLILIFVGVVVFAILKWTPSVALTFFLIELVVSVFFGYIFAIRVGGADMPITISLLNAFSGVAGAIAGLAINDLLLVAVGGIVGASGLLLTQIMCKSMNRKLMDIMLGKTTMQHKKGDAAQAKVVEQIVETQSQSKVAEADPIAILNNAKDVIIVPGYGMAIAQAQHLVKQLADLLVSRGVKVRYAVHPVAGRMPGHMNVLLCEANVDYEDLYEMDTINPDFEKADAAIIVGANDVLNPAAREAKDTPIYGMPVLNVDKCKNIFIFNYDLKPGYAGVENPIYTRKQGVYKYLGNAAETLATLIDNLKNGKNTKKETVVEVKTNVNPIEVMKKAKDVIIVPGYGMAIAQAQHLVKQLADLLVSRGVKVRYAVHPVAGRMPGHMNVLLCEANVDYEDLYEMDTINPDFEKADAAIIVGANDVLNPAAREAKDTPIYGMPVLNVDKCKNIFIFNYDLKPGYAGVENPIYTRKQGVYLNLGDASKTLADFINSIK